MMQKVLKNNEVTELQPKHIISFYVKGQWCRVCRPFSSRKPLTIIL